MCSGAADDVALRLKSGTCNKFGKVGYAQRSVRLGDKYAVQATAWCTVVACTSQAQKRNTVKITHAAAVVHSGFSGRSMLGRGLVYDATRSLGTSTSCNMFVCACYCVCRALVLQPHSVKFGALLCYAEGDWSSGMIRASGARGPEFDSRITPFLLGQRHADDVTQLVDNCVCWSSAKNTNNILRTFFTSSCHGRDAT